MKTKSLVVTVSFLLIVFVWFSATHNSKMKRSLSVAKIDNRGIFVGERNAIVSGESIQEKIGKEISESWNNIRLGDQYAKQGDYEKAAKNYWNAYRPRYGEKPLAGLLFAETCEKTGQYDEGIALLDQMIKNGELSEKGVQNANEIKSRLLAASATKKADPSYGGKAAQQKT